MYTTLTTHSLKKPKLLSFEIPCIFFLKWTWIFLNVSTSILRECPALVRLQMRAVGLGCHEDHIYVDLRPLVPGHERVYVMVWEEGDTGYCDDVKGLQKNMIEGQLLLLPVDSCKHQ